jgi:hypothetical protein
MSFLEPMITYATLQAGGSQSFNVRQPSAYQRTGYYPSEYGYTFDGDIYDVYLGGLALATSPVPEPSTYGLAAAATLGFGLYLRRRRQWRARKTRREPLDTPRPRRARRFAGIKSENVSQRTHDSASRSESQPQPSVHTTPQPRRCLKMDFADNSRD